MEENKYYVLIIWCLTVVVLFKIFNYISQAFKKRNEI